VFDIGCEQHGQYVPVEQPLGGDQEEEEAQTVTVPKWRAGQTQAISQYNPAEEALAAQQQAEDGAQQGEGEEEDGEGKEGEEGAEAGQEGGEQTQQEGAEGGEFISFVLGVKQKNTGLYPVFANTLFLSFI